MPATAHQSAPASLLSQLDQSREQTDALFDLVRPEDLYERPVAQRHRLIFYLGHVEAFDWNMICRYALSLPAFHAGFDQLFAFGIDPDASGLPTDGPSDWPTLEEVRAYSRRVRETVDQVLVEAPAQVAHVAIEHRLMHAETLCYLMHNLPAAKKITPPASVQPSGTPPESAWIDIPEGVATLGQPSGDSFGWDNEFEETRVEVPAFSIARYSVTNGEYLRFIEEGGSAPHYWTKEDGQWRLRLMFGETPLPLDWPVYATHDQASAFAKWSGRELPSEAEFHRAAYGTPEGEERPFPWGADPPGPERGNFDFHRWDPQPVTAHPSGESSFGVAQMVGNGWQWTRDKFQPLPGFEEFEFYPGYSANFFDDQHYVLKGGSPRTAVPLLRRSFRNWFRHEYEHAYATFHCVEH